MLGKTLILGGSGLLGQALVSTLRQLHIPPLTPSHAELDVLDFRALENYLAKHKPSIIFNAVAYTQVDKAEDEEDAAMRLNRDLPARLAEFVAEKNIWLMHYSTDFVFDGNKKTPYLPSDAINPLNAYGRSKLAGEKAILATAPENSCIVRTAWLFGPGGKNFVKTVISKAMEGEPLRIVDDQIGSPTFTDDLAHYSLSLANIRKPGIFHIVNQGAVSWYDLAQVTLRIMDYRSPLTAIKTGEFPSKAARPAYSALNSKDFILAAGIVPRSWLAALEAFLGAYTV